MLLGIPRSARCVQGFVDSLKICNSHYLSHFAAFFIDARAKRSVAESCIKFIGTSAQCYILLHTMGYMKNVDLEMQRKPAGAGNPPDRVSSESQSKSTRGAQVERSGYWAGTWPRKSQQQPHQVHAIMILLQVHLRRPCYDFYF